MARMATISIGNEDQQTPDRLKVRLVGVDYEVRPPKMWAAMRTTQKLQGLATGGDDMTPEAVGDAVDAMEAWLRGAVSKADADEIMARLDDPDDQLDLTHIAALIEQVTEASTGDPTT